MNRIASLLVYGSDLAPQTSPVGAPCGAIRILVEESGGQYFLRQEGVACVDARECIDVLGAEAVKEDYRDDDEFGVRIEVETP